MIPIKIRARRERWNDAVDLYFIDASGGAILKNMELEKVKEGEVVPPSFVMDELSTQALFDDLYNEGYRPSEERNETSAYKEAKDHIADLKNVVGNLFELIKTGKT